MARSPLVSSISWGAIYTTDLGEFRDAKFFPGGGRSWDWRETNTHHVPGIQPADVDELIENGSEVVVLTRGMQLALQTCPQTIQLLRDLSIEVYVEETNRAVEIYNQLASEGVAVGGLFHSTC